MITASKKKKPSLTTLVEALDRNLTSQDWLDQNLEPANLVDGLFAVANAIDRLADALARGSGSDGKPSPLDA